MSLGNLRQSTYFLGIATLLRRVRARNPPAAPARNGRRRSNAATEREGKQYVISRSWRTTAGPSALPREAENGLQTVVSASPHTVEEVRVAFRRLDLVEQKLHRFELVHRVEQLAQDPHLLQDVGPEQELLAARSGAIDVDRRVDALLGHPAVEMDFHIAGAFEFLVDHIVHPRPGVDQRRRDDR